MRKEELIHQIAISFFNPLRSEHICRREENHQDGKIITFQLKPESYPKRCEAISFRIDSDGEVHYHEMIRGKSNLTREIILARLEKVNRLIRGEKACSQG